MLVHVLLLVGGQVAAPPTVDHTEPPATEVAAQPGAGAAVQRVAVPALAVVSINRPAAIPGELAVTVEAGVRESLEAAGFELQPAAVTVERLGKRDPIACEANVTCFSLLAAAAGAPAIIRVEGSVVQTDVAVYVQAIAAEDGRMVADRSFVTAIANVEQGMRAELRPFVQKLKDAAATLQVPDAPRRIALEPPRPAPVVAPPQFIERPAVAPSRTPAYAVGAAALVASAVAIGFTAVAASERSCFDGPAIGGHPSVCVPRSQADDVAARANAHFTVGATAGALSVALLGATAWLWTHPD